MKTTLRHGAVAALFPVLSLVSLTSIAQNLVPNAGFETQTSCPAVSEITKATPWNSPTQGTPDLFNSTCSTQNSAGRTGIGSSGVYCYSVFPDNREYLQVPLTQALAAGQNYCVSFYVKRTNFRYSVSTIGAYFSMDSVRQQTTSYLTFTPDVESPVGTQLSSSTSWTEVSGSFTASGGEKYLLIGNFRNDANTTKAVANSSSTDSVAYYKVDDVSVTLCTTGISEIAADHIVRVYPTPAADRLHIELTNMEEIEAVELTDVIGTRVAASYISEGINKAMVNTDSLSTGYYILTVTTQSGRMSRKVLVSK
ncbi:MAG: T9SS type A sorting domain-containing protein [Bacteroidetes bacterium]|nr:T9SS type A sorting domain-containing protein [Bacteroidota bacterium]